MLIEIEGPSGAGKSALIVGLCAGPPEAAGARRFVSAGAAEQNDDGLGWAVGTFMREYRRPMPPHEAVFLYGARAAARARMIARLRAPGVVVLADRLRLSLHVQALLAGMTPADARSMTRLATGATRPDLTVLLLVDHDGHCRRQSAACQVPQAESDFTASCAHFEAAYQEVTDPALRLDTTGITQADVRSAVLAMVSTAGQPVS